MNRLSVVVFGYYCGVDVATKLGVHATSTRAEISVGTEAVQERREGNALLRLLWPGMSIPVSMHEGAGIEDIGSLDQLSMNIRRVAVACTELNVGIKAKVPKYVPNNWSTCHAVMTDIINNLYTCLISISQ